MRRELLFSNFSLKKVYTVPQQILPSHLLTKVIHSLCPRNKAPKQVVQNRLVAKTSLDQCHNLRKQSQLLVYVLHHVDVV